MKDKLQITNELKSLKNQIDVIISYVENLCDEHDWECEGQFDNWRGVYFCTKCGKQKID